MATLVAIEEGGRGSQTALAPAAAAAAVAAAAAAEGTAELRPHATLPPGAFC